MYWIIGLFLFIVILNWKFKFLKLEWIEEENENDKNASDKSVLPKFEFKVERRNENLHDYRAIQTTSRPKKTPNQPYIRDRETKSPIPIVSERFTTRTDRYTDELIDYHIVEGKLDTERIVVDIPYRIKEICDKMENGSIPSDSDFLHENYWVIVWYKGERHAYKGTNDLWTYSARELPELPIIHNWVYHLLGKTKPSFSAQEIFTVKTWVDNKNHVWGRGTANGLDIEFSCSLKGFIRNFNLKSREHGEDRARYNQKTSEYSFHFYYSDCSSAIVEWANKIISEYQKPKA